MNASAAIADVLAKGMGPQARGRAVGVPFLSPRAPGPSSGFHAIFRWIVI